MQVEQTEIPGVLLITPKRFGDDRGFFSELFHGRRYAESGMDMQFVQDNYSRSCRGTLRGLHHQYIQPQDKMVWVMDGEIFDVVVDARVGSPAFGKWFGVNLSAADNRQIFIPKGCLHGFAVLSERADVVYKCTDYYCPEGEQGVAWDDPDIGIRWPVEQPILSPKDEANILLKEVPEEHLLPWRK